VVGILGQVRKHGEFVFDPPARRVEHRGRASNRRTVRPLAATNAAIWRPIVPAPTTATASIGRGPGSLSPAITPLPSVRASGSP
jgi:hypothetical protein